jgi:hypothetical protein
MVSWLPLRLLTKQQALAAMMLAQAASSGIGPDDQRVESWAHELGLTGSEAIARLTGE